MIPKKKKTKKLPNVDSFVKIKLRRASIFWKGRTLALINARVSPGKYKCNMCQQVFGMIKVEVVDKKGNKKYRYKNPMEVDHIESVVPMDGSGQRKDDPKRIDWNLYIDRLFVGPEKLAVLCKQCHSVKTDSENSMREYYKKEKKK